MIEKDRLINEIIESIKVNPIESSGHTYQPIPFPGFDTLKTSLNKKEFYKKWNLISRVLPDDMQGLKVLDIGANAGFMSYKCAQKGSFVDAIEPHDRYFDLGPKLTDIYNLNIKWHKEPITDAFFKTNKMYDFTFMMSVLQWITEGDKHLDVGKNLLHDVSINSKNLIFELGFNSGKSAITTTKINKLSHVYKLLNDCTEYTNIYLLGKSKLWGSNRYIFLCTHDKSVQIDEPWHKFLKHLRI